VLTVHQVNLQTLVGGGELYTRALTRALLDAGAGVRLYVRRDNAFWDTLEGSRAEIVRVADAHEISQRLPAARSLVLAQTLLPPDCAARLGATHYLTCFAHMPLHGRSAAPYRAYRSVLTVSQYCLDLLRAGGVAQAYPEPLYGTYDLDRPVAARITARSRYAWDRRKVRDRMMGWAEPLGALFEKERVYEKRAGLTLGIVSLLVPIKQFPALFSVLAPIIARHPLVWLEVFGSGGYAQVRDIRAALAPIAERVRWWGYQPSVQAVYPHLDYLMTGLPEKEALGLNAIEAQACGLPVLAPNAPPFTETVQHGTTGFLYQDPRRDGGAEFARLLDSLIHSTARPAPQLAGAHLAKFSYEALVGRARRLLQHFERELDR
jgi:glycosyltransferase involved in cell wall biosynthesis